ncbi:DUF6894 family protein [Methylobacterium brachythecii]|uniref:DUF6894 family protein n=1 Tax=Methylobacterium brachythecii TaxID=1176177 RepID=UPI003F67B00B
MPRYFFNLYDGVVRSDLDGIDLPNLGAARLEAVGFAALVLKDYAKDIIKGDD